MRRQEEERMTWQMYLINTGKFLNVCVVYWVIQLGRCVLFSFLLLPLILLVRKVLPRNFVFLRGLVWSILFVLPFLGRLRLFYETKIGVRGMIWWNNLCMEHVWLCWIYIAGIVGMWFYLVRKRRKLRKHILRMEQSELNGTRIYVSEMAVSPFAFGLVFPRIVMPEMFFKEYGEEEMDMVLLHEKTHIRLGHLWIYYIYDIWRVLFWLNPLFTICMKYLRADMEGVCDKVVLRKLKKPVYEYGQLLIKSIHMLQTETGDFPAAFIGQKEYRNFKERLKLVLEYRPYRSRLVTAACLCAVGFLVLVLSGLHRISYPLYTEDESVMIYDDSFKVLMTDDQKALRGAFSVDEENAYIKREAMDQVLNEKKIDAKRFYISFGGYMKLPGMGGGTNAVYVDYEGTSGDLVIPYRDCEKDWWIWLFKRM